MKTTSLVISMILAVLLCGCSMLNLKDGLTLEQQAEKVQGLARAATFLAITEVYKENAEDQVEKATEFKQIIEDYILPTLAQRALSLHGEAASELIAQIPREYWSYMNTAFLVFDSYFETPQIGIPLSADQIALLEALFTGISEGCSQVLLVNKIDQ